MSSPCYAGTVPVEQETEYYTWRPQNGSYSVRLHANAINRINIEVMRGFAVTRRRGTEPGGLLLGRFDTENETVVTVDDVEVVSCEYSQGPSYILSATDLAAFRQALESYGSGEKSVVGYWRGHTRDGLSLSEADVLLFREYIRDPRACALLVRPYASRDAVARLFLQDAAGIQTTGTPPEFPFVTPSRMEALTPSLQPLAPPPHAPASLPLAPPAIIAPIPVAPPSPDAPIAAVPKLEPVPVSAPAPKPVIEMPVPLDRPKRVEALLEERPMFGHYEKVQDGSWKRTALLISFALAAMLLGAVAGFQYAGGSVPLFANALAHSEAGRNPFDIHMGVSSAGGNVHLRWDRTAPAIAAAVRGMLTITESGSTKNVALGVSDLQAGAIIYYKLGSPVVFRLEIVLSENVSVIQSIEWSGTSVPPRDSRLP